MEDKTVGWAREECNLYPALEFGLIWTYCICSHCKWLMFTYLELIISGGFCTTVLSLPRLWLIKLISRVLPYSYMYYLDFWHKQHKPPCYVLVLRWQTGTNFTLPNSNNPKSIFNSCMLVESLSVIELNHSHLLFYIPINLYMFYIWKTLGDWNGSILAPLWLQSAIVT